MKPIGGYFELELSKGEEFHKNAVCLNTARNSFEYILRAKRYKKVYLPYFTCEVMLEPINKLGLAVDFYDIDDIFKPIFDFSEVNADEVFLYTNYFGLCDNLISEIAEECRNVIIDNAQAFFAKPLQGIDTFYSPRKFLGVPDGAYLYTNTLINEKIEQDISYNRFEHLLGRIDLGAEKFYRPFTANDESFINQPIKLMSNLTKKLLSSLDYKSIAEKRKENFKFLEARLAESNLLSVQLPSSAVPMIYPYFVDNSDQLRSVLIKNKVFVAQYWPNVLDWAEKNINAYRLTQGILALPIDQRYDISDMIRILKILDNA